jgi:hypothetical protein
MEELIFFAVLIFFSIIESIARSRKQRTGGTLPDTPGEAPAEWGREAGQAQRPGPRPAPQPRPRMSDVPSYDEDASFDARARQEGRSFDEAATSDEERRRRAASSESMIPADIWREIEGLAREAKVELPLPAPRPKPQSPRPQAQLPKPGGARQRKRPAPKSPQRMPPTVPQPRRPALPEPTVEGAAAHPVHLSHAGYGTDPSDRARAEQDLLAPTRSASAANAVAVREQLRSQGANALRQALILQEVLGPPAASKPDRFSE